MKKYWIGMSFVKVALGMMAGYVILESAMCLLQEARPFNLLPLVGVLLGSVLAVLVITAPVGIWKVFWVEDGCVCEQHLLTRRVRRMALDAQHPVCRRETLRTTWLIVTKDKASADMKQAKALYRQAKAMLIPVEGVLVAPLGEITAKAPCIY